MLLKTVRLQNFRNHKKLSLDLGNTTVLVGKNTIGKTNILEAIRLLSIGKSFRAENDRDCILFGETFCRIEGVIANYIDESLTLTVVLSDNNRYLSKKFLVNNVPKRKQDFVSNIYTVLFTPSDIDIIVDSPHLRRNYIDSVLIQSDKTYHLSSLLYEKALKQRNRMLYFVKEGRKIARKEEFEYWDNLLIEHGSVIHQKRKEFVEFINKSEKSMFPFDLFYDESTVTSERLAKYFEVEQKTGVTLIGPQRDDFVFFISKTDRKIKEFSSRGEQRLTVLQTKILEIIYLKEKTGESPVLLLDDIFSELDSENITKVIALLENQQSIITTTHEEFIPEKLKKTVLIVKLPHHSIK